MSRVPALPPLKVLVVSQYFWPEVFRINEVVESLQGAGCEVVVLTGQPNYPQGNTYPGFRPLGLGQDRHAGCTVFRVPLLPRGQSAAWRLAANYLSFVLSASTLGAWLLRGRRVDVVFVYGISPILQVLPGMVLRHLKGAALVAWVQDLWPDSLQATGYVQRPGLLAAVGKLVRWIYRRCDLILVPSRAFIQSIDAMASGRVPVAYHPNPGELAFSAPPDPGPPATVLPAGFNVMFAGNLGTVQSLDTLLDGAERLLGVQDVRLVLVGSGSRAAWVQAEIARRGLRNVSLPGRFEPEQMPSILAQASALVVSLNRGSTMDRTVPNKVQAYLAAGKPIIASLDGEGARIVTESGAGIACEAENVDQWVQAVLRVHAMSPAERAAMGAAGTAYYARHFEPTQLARQLVAHFACARALRAHGKASVGPGSSR